MPETKHGSVGLYQCKDGYAIKGQNVTTCNYGNWTGHTPNCDILYCPYPAKLEDIKKRDIKVRIIPLLHFSFR